MRTSNLLALSFLVAGGCSAERVSTEQQAESIIGSVYITQVFGAGGNGGAAVDHDYVELTNIGADAVTLAAYSVFYRGSTGNTWQSTALPPNLVIPAGGNYLVTEAGTVGVGTAISGDTQGSISMAAGAGVVALDVTGTTTHALPATGVTTVDLVGYGSATTLHEGAAPAPTPSATKADIRKSETNDNSVDFMLGTPAPVNAAALPDMDVDMQPDLTPVVDMVVTDAGPYTAALNEVKWNPAGSDNGQEFVELIGTGTLPPHTFVVSVSGDAEAAVSTVGKIDYAYDVSATPFGANGLILIKAAATTFLGVPGATTATILNDANLNTAKLGNFTETTMLIQVNDPVATPIVTGGTIPASTAYTILDSLAVREPIAVDGGTAGVPDPIYGTAVLEACASEVPGKTYPPSGASRLVGNTTTESATAWVAGQAYGASTDQFLSNVADCSTSAAPPQTWSMSPGFPNDMPEQPAPDLLNAPVIDLSTPAEDFAVSSGGDDLAATVPDFAHVPTNDGGGGTIKPGGSIGGSGCNTGGRGSIGWTSALLLIGLVTLLRSRRRTH